MVLLRVFMSRAVALIAVLAGCDVGEVPIGGTGTDGGSNINACADRGTIGTAYQHGGGAGTRAGQGCIAVACHLAGQTGAGAGAFTAAGTVYKLDKTTPNGGAVIRVKSGGTALTAVADDAGNFVIRGTFTFPATTEATACPDTSPMAGPLTTGGGNCNGGACHALGSTQGPIKFQAL